jgi:hypothetical protein
MAEGLVNHFLDEERLAVFRRVRDALWEQVLVYLKVAIRPLPSST